MAQITTETCSGYYDGTNNYVRLEFMNSIPRKTCITDYLYKSGDEFAANQTSVWEEEMLQSCAENKFRPIGGLSFRFLTNTWGINMHHDQLRLCKVTAQFGRPELAGYSVWQWTGDLYNAHYSGGESQSNWTTMAKIAG